MTLQHINITDLTVSPLNVRKYGAKDCADLVTSIRTMGLLQPLLVRPTENGFEVIAGQRRLNACLILAEEGASDPIPCLVMREGDDAAAIEASLAENIDRLPMDEVDQFKAFTKLVGEGRSVEAIAQTFGLTERLVTQRLALGRLHGPILTAYRKDDIHAHDIRLLTMATPKQQRAWWGLVKDEEAYAPTGQRLKDWLFGGAHIPTSNALFDVEASDLAVIADLFGDEAYFADCDAFWPLQNAAIAERADIYRADGWADIVILDQGTYFATWDHVRTDKATGGKVFVTCTSQGEVTFHEGFLTKAEAKRRDKAEAGSHPAPKPELTKAAQNYVDLHRHAAVRSDLLGHSGIALRLIAAHMIAGSSLWQVEAEPQKTTKPEIAESLEANTGQIAFAKEQAEIAGLLGFHDNEGRPYDPKAYVPCPCLTEVFERLQALSDKVVLRIMTGLMAESLSVASSLIDTLGQIMGTDMRQHWQADDTFVALIRDKQVLNAMVGEIAGESTAKQHVTSTAKDQKAVIAGCLDGSRPTQTEQWVPRFMVFPRGSYRNEVQTHEVSDDEPQRQAA